MVVMKVKQKISVGDYVRFRGQLGIVKEKKLINVPLPMSNYNLFRVEFEDTNREWINEMYLVKA
jgi:hypothetical protein